MRSAVSTSRELSRSRSAARPFTSVSSDWVRFCTSCSSLRLPSSFFLASSFLEWACAKAGAPHRLIGRPPAWQRRRMRRHTCKRLANAVLSPMQRPVSPYGVLPARTRGRNCGNYGAPGIANALLRKVNSDVPSPQNLRYDLRASPRRSKELPRTENERLMETVLYYLTTSRSSPWSGGAFRRAVEFVAGQEPEHQPEADALARRAAGARHRHHLALRVRPQLQLSYAAASL